MKKKILSLLALSLAFSCNAPNNIDNTLNTTKSSSSISQSGNDIVIDVSKGKFKGADLTLNIKDLKKFSVKQSQQGSVNLFGSVKSYMVYLVANPASTYPTDGSADPLADKVLGPFVFNANNNEFPAVKFTNVPPSGSNYYYFAVRAFDGMNATGTELIKPDNGNSTPWNGTSAGMPIAVSSGNGVMVAPDYTISPSGASIVNIQTTLGATGAAILDAHVKFLNTSATSIASYKVNFCTDPLNPTNTSVLSSPFTIPKGQSFTDDIIQLTNLPEGSYYLTVESAGDLNLNNPNLIDQSTNFTPPVNYNDSSNNLVVSSNYVTIDNNQQYTFSDAGDWFNINIPLVTNVIYPIQADVPILIDSSSLHQPGVASDKNGNVYVADVPNNRIIKIASDGVLSTFISGGGIASYNLTTDMQGNLYVADQANKNVKKYNSSGTLLLTISNQSDGVTPLNDPTGIAVDGSGNIYVSDVVDTTIGSPTMGSSKIFKYDSSGTPIGATEIAGNSSGSGTTGDVGSIPATNADLRWVLDIAVSPDGAKLYISEGGYSLIKQVDFPSAMISTIAGGGVTGISPARTLNLTNPSGIELDSQGNLYISDIDNDRVIKVETLSSGNYSIVAGLGSSTPTTTLPLIKSTSASLNRPFGLEVDQVGNLYITDKDSSNNVRVLKVTR